MTIINLETTQFVFAEVVDYLVHYTVIHVNGKPRSVTNFCVVLIGNTQWDHFVLGEPTDYPVAFRCPKDWNLAQIMYKLGAHKSLEAAKSQWANTSVPDGLTEMLITIRGNKGALTLFKD